MIAIRALWRRLRHPDPSKATAAQNQQQAQQLVNRGNAQRTAGELMAAVCCYQEAFALSEERVDALFNAGVLLQELGRTSEAEAAYRRVLELELGHTTAQICLALVLHARGAVGESVPLLFDLVASDPGNHQLRNLLARALRGVRLSQLGVTGRKILLSLCVDDNIDAMLLVTPICALIQSTEGFRTLQQSARADSDPFDACAAATDEFVRDSLLLALLPRAIIPNLELESVLTHVRRWLLIRSDCDGESAVPPSS